MQVYQKLFMIYMASGNNIVGIRKYYCNYSTLHSNSLLVSTLLTQLYLTLCIICDDFIDPNCKMRRICCKEVCFAEVLQQYLSLSRAACK